MWGSEKKVKNYDTLISNKAVIMGDVKVEGGLHVDGKICGNVIAEEGTGALVRISDKGEVIGEIHAPNIIINGRVEGDVFSSEHIELSKKAIVTGDVYYSMMEMVMGSSVNGKLVNTNENANRKKSETVEIADQSDNKSSVKIKASDTKNIEKLAVKSSSKSKDKAKDKQKEPA